MVNRKQEQTAIVSYNRPAVLRVSPYAWAKFKWLRDLYGSVAGFGISATQPLQMIDFVPVLLGRHYSLHPSETTIQDYLKELSAQGCKPTDYSCIWLQTTVDEAVTQPHLPVSDILKLFKRCETAALVYVCGDDCGPAWLYKAGATKLETLDTTIVFSEPFDGVTQETLVEWQDEAAKADIFIAPTATTGAKTTNYAPPKEPPETWLNEQSDLDLYTPDEQPLKLGPPNVYYLSNIIGDTERVERITYIGGDTAWVTTTNAWLVLPPGVKPQVKEGDLIKTFDDISSRLPIYGGTVIWELVEEKRVPFYASIVVRVDEYGLDLTYAEMEDYIISLLEGKLDREFVC